MLSYLSKFVLQMLPTITATVIGAYIVSTWINPKAPATGAVRTAVWPSNKLAEGSPKPAEPAAATDVTDGASALEAAEKVRVIPIVKEAEGAAERPASAAVVPPASQAQTQEHRDAAELARLAIQRLRGESDTGTAPHEPAARPATAVLRPQPQPRPALASLPQAASGPMSGPPTAIGAALATAAPPLPPAVTITTPAPPPALDKLADTKELEADRLVPPREVPAVRDPLSLQAATHRVTENPSLADDVVSATKSFFRAITPQQLQR
ncbi:MAG: hypothetical protein R3D69_06575 [Xanthobacteraceae bacterium]